MHQGKTHIVTDAPLEKMPLFVRAGAIIPLAPVMQYTDERPIDELRLRVYPGEGEWTLYEDDGHSFEYRTGAWATTTYRVHSNEGETIVEIAARQGEWQPRSRQVIVEVVGKGEQQFEEDGSDRRLTFT
jgi:alpha-glucosidase